ncbi:MAG TPA: hypothetical protein VN442_00720 [Bryobacteraceae bacterium]|nr:hypothetical protein [Bryobacteraceae bacterium]
MFAIAGTPLPEEYRLSHAKPDSDGQDHYQGRHKGQDSYHEYQVQNPFGESSVHPSTPERFVV